MVNHAEPVPLYHGRLPAPLRDDLNWKLVYVGSSESEKYGRGFSWGCPPPARP